MDMTHERKCPPAAEAGRCAGCIDVSTWIRRHVDRDPTRGRRLIGAHVLEVTREHWLGNRPALVAPVRFPDDAQSARIGQALAPTLG